MGKGYPPHLPGFKVGIVGGQRDGCKTTSDGWSLEVLAVEGEPNDAANSSVHKPSASFNSRSEEPGDDIVAGPVLKTLQVLNIG